MPTGDTMRHTSEAIWDAMGLTVAFHTKGTQGTLHETGIKDIMARRGLSWNGSLPGPGADFTGRQSDAKGTVTAVSGLRIWHGVMMYWRVLG